MRAVRLIGAVRAIAHIIAAKPATHPPTARPCRCAKPVIRRKRTCAARPLSWDPSLEPVPAARAAPSCTARRAHSVSATNRYDATGRKSADVAHKTGARFCMSCEHFLSCGYPSRPVTARFPSKHRVIAMGTNGDFFERLRQSLRASDLFALMTIFLPEGVSENSGALSVMGRKIHAEARRDHA